MARISRPKSSTGKKILLIDDQNDYLEATSSLLKREGHEVIAVTSGEQGLELLKKEHFDLLLIDYFMPGGMNGEEVVNKLREFNNYTQVILQTGYAGEYPPREMLKKLDIQGYYDKTEGPEKLLLWVDVGLKAAFTIQLLLKSRLGLQYILDVTPELHKIQQIQEIFQGILHQVSGLVGIVNSFIAIFPENRKDNLDFDAKGFIATIEENSLVIQVGTGKFSGRNNISEVIVPEKLNEMNQIINSKKIYIDDTRTIVPLVLREEILGIIYLDRTINHPQDIELLQIFANQAAVAIHNAILHEMATFDTLTGAFVRRFFDQWLIRELRTCFRSQTIMTLLLVDMDKLKFINDTYGHVIGDKALTIIGKILKESTRTTDFVGRYGGDEFAVILPQTKLEQSKIVIDRILNFLKVKTIEMKEAPLQVSVSIGACSINPHKFDFNEMPRPISQGYFESMAKELVLQTDKMLYKSKDETEKSNYHKCDINWLPFK